MGPADYAANLILSILLILGVYQFYFWCQRNPLNRARELNSLIDDRIPYKPGWVWVYGFLYYPMILYINWTVESYRHFFFVAASFMLLLMLQAPFFLFFPVEIPERWRSCNRRRGASERFLAFLQRFDGRSNSFPSLHISVATLTALHLYPALGSWAFAFPVLISLSCLFTKQHYLADLPAGMILGWFAFWIYSRFAP